LAKTKSKKPSASNNVAQPETVTLFIDRCAWSRPLGEALDQIGANYIAHRDRFEPDAPDEVWLEAAGREGWAVITRDKRIRWRPAELEAFRDHKVIVFVLVSGNVSAAETATLISSLYPKIVRLAAAAKPPAMYRVTRSGSISLIKIR
jgi:predicted nuclease of predicted toxin-antitoxin system